jgi:alpha-glucoside transport system substrate-binding protein
MKRGLLLTGLVLLLASFVFLGGCSKKSDSAPATSSGAKVGGTTSLIASWQGNEQDVLTQMLKPFEDKSGIQVNYTGSRDMMAIVTTRVAAGNPPDLVAFPNPAQMQELATKGSLKPLDGVLDMATIKSQYSPGWIDRGTVNGKLYGIFTKAAAKGFIWYDVQSGQSVGLTPSSVPTTWQGLLDLSNKIAQGGATQWAIGVESGAASGWVGTDWLENIFLKKYGPDEYMKWYKGELPWTSEEIKSI